MINFEKVTEAANGCFRIGQQPCRAVEEMLRRVVRTVSDKWSGVDDEPWLSLRAQNIPCMEISGQQHIVERWTRQPFANAKALSDQAGVGPLASCRHRLPLKT